MVFGSTLLPKPMLSLNGICPTCWVRPGLFVAEAPEGYTLAESQRVAQVVTYDLFAHKPRGCTCEESYECCRG